MVAAKDVSILIIPPQEVSFCDGAEEVHFPGEGIRVWIQFPRPGSEVTVLC